MLLHLELLLANFLAGAILFFVLVDKPEVPLQLQETGGMIALLLAYAPVIVILATSLATYFKVKKVEHRSNSQQQLHLEHFVDLYEELLQLNPDSTNAQEKLAAARVRLADHKGAEKILEDR